MSKNWKNKYLKFISAENFEEAIPLKTNNFPNSFFKFRHLSLRTIESIKDNYIWLAEISSLNDPFECSVQIDNNECLRQYHSTDGFKKMFKFLSGHELTEKEVKLLTTSTKPHETYVDICKNHKLPFSLTPEQHLDKVNERWNQIVKDINLELRICSFSTTKKSLLLWSHYADEHKGISIEYDFVDTELVTTFIQPVIYRDLIEKLGFFDEYSVMKMVGSSLIKSKDWKYEKEWRLTIFKQKENFPQKVNVPKPIAIYLGSRFDLNEEKLKIELFKIAVEREIPIFKMIKHPNEFKLIADKTQLLSRR
ncbi:DUF2971 domain-containing protein [Subsaximicrobium wynnwilliamsii]|uniref:DUF2971 domain-containing protein n=1 Tax=Subsaximicrobium wynnwilliamsii TaxID=291179 RepID=A0A5C6ZBL8_9FLAO|nr:DUF2971 domain-containing protein [Subsaximicrobium wynnwilliamsii]TXD81489.1 DUF2971 domain-containing protein [Subsaximicrobium wynnwilliamsii]TXD87156.1 DUF2971 domain-containing protein [Subsaximicrobium wynnwilliamsii]TXE00849.1 DUF2971 domain-containing protein [Subsaximicrobium wynnwilliamsii]